MATSVDELQMSLHGVCHTVPWGEGGGTHQVCLSALHTVFLPLLWPRKSTDMLYKVELGHWDSGGSCAWDPLRAEVSRMDAEASATL